jgi:hypothetical protein
MANTSDVAVGHRLAANLLLGHQLGQGAGQGIDLVRVQLRPVA